MAVKSVFSQPATTLSGDSTIILAIVYTVLFSWLFPKHKWGQRGKTTTGSALDGAVFDIAQILAYLVHNMSSSQLYLGLVILADSLLFSVNTILVGLWLNCISSVEITLFLLADILLHHWALFQCYGIIKSFLDPHVN